MIKDIKLYITGDYTPGIGELNELGEDLRQLMIKHPYLGGYETNFEQKWQNIKNQIFLKQVCHDCGVKEGEIHEPDDVTQKGVHFCECQLIICGCCYEKLGLVNNQKYPDTGGLPPKIYKEGLTNNQAVKWEEILEKKGKIPFIIRPVWCGRCLQPYPNFFKVPDKEWKKITKSNAQRGVVSRLL